MFINPGMQVTVTGGTHEENLQLTSVIHQSMKMCGFTNVGMAPNIEPATLPLLAQLRIINPELFDTKVTIGVAPVMAPIPVVDLGVAPNAFHPFGILGI